MGKFLRSIITKKVEISLDLTTLNTAARELVRFLATRGVRVDVPTARGAVIAALQAVGKPAQKS